MTSNAFLHEAKKRLHKVRKEITEGERDKKQIEQKIKDLEKSRDDKVKQIEKEKRELEQTLSKAQGAKNPNKEHIQQLRSEIQSKTFAINHEGEAAREEIKKHRGKLHDVNQAQAGRRRVEAALSGTLIPTLESQREDLLQTGVDLYSSGGTIGARNYAGLQTVQGQGSTTDEVPDPPPIGMLGGEIFAVQNRLRELGAGKEKTPPGKTPLEEEAEALEKEINATWHKRYLISQAQFQTLSGFPSVQQLDTPPVPFAGNYAIGSGIGGVVAAKVGERGAEIVAMPTGSQVLSNREAKNAVRPASEGPLQINFENVYFSEDGTVTGSVNGESFQTQAKKVGSKPRTPGGKRR